MITDSPLDEHIVYPSFNKKTICTAACLQWFGIFPNEYRYSDSFERMKAILRRKGFMVRSRFSYIPKKKRTIEGVREWLKERAPEHAEYLVAVKKHAMVLDYTGEILVDTDPETIDRREVLGIWLVYSPHRALLRIRHSELQKEKANHDSAR